MDDNRAYNIQASLEVIEQNTASIAASLAVLAHNSIDQRIMAEGRSQGFTPEQEKYLRHMVNSQLPESLQPLRKKEGGKNDERA